MDREARLSPAARMALDEYVEEVRQEVLRRAVRNASVDADDLVIGVREIVGAATQLSFSRRDRDDVRGQLLRLYGISAALLVLTGFAALALLNLGSLDGPELVAAVTGVAGVVLGAATAFLMARQQVGVDSHRMASDASPYAPNEMAWEVARSFGQLERALRSALALRAGESVSSGPPTQLMAAAVKSGVWSPEQAEQFRRIVRVRNEVVHGGSPAESEVSIAMHDLAELSRALRTVSN